MLLNIFSENLDPPSSYVIKCLDHPLPNPTLPVEIICSLVVSFKISRIQILKIQKTRPNLDQNHHHKQTTMRKQTKKEGNLPKPLPSFTVFRPLLCLPPTTIYLRWFWSKFGRVFCILRIWILEISNYTFVWTLGFYSDTGSSSGLTCCFGYSSSVLIFIKTFIKTFIKNFNKIYDYLWK